MAKIDTSTWLRVVNLRRRRRQYGRRRRPRLTDRLRVQNAWRLALAWHNGLTDDYCGACRWSAREGALALLSLHERRQKLAGQNWVDLTLEEAGMKLPKRLLTIDADQPASTCCDPARQCAIAAIKARHAGDALNRD